MSEAPHVKRSVPHPLTDVEKCCKISPIHTRMGFAINMLPYTSHAYTLDRPSVAEPPSLGNLDFGFGA